MREERRNRRIEESNCKHDFLKLMEKIGTHEDPIKRDLALLIKELECGTSQHIGSVK